jgi:hypothetical protein
MAKINISFNSKDYSIDESSLSASSAALRNHLSSVMNGSGATIAFGGTSYGVDSTKLSAATNDFTSYLRTIAGTGGGGEPLLIEWDGKSAGSISVDASDIGMGVFQKISDLVLTDEQIKGCYITMASTYRNGNYTKFQDPVPVADIWEEFVNDGMVEEQAVVLGYVVCTRIDNATTTMFPDLVFPEAGVYFVAVEADSTEEGVYDSFCSSLSNPNVTVGGSTTNIVVNGVKYPIDYSKLTDAVAQIEAVLAGLNSGSGGSGDVDFYIEKNEAGGETFYIIGVNASLVNEENNSGGQTAMID